MKLTAILVSFLLFSNAIAAGLPFKPQTDTVVIGKDASTDNKEIIFNTGDGAGNPKIEVDNTTKEINANTSLRVFEKLRLGNNSAYVKWDSSLERLVYSNNGVLEKKIGSGSGSGDEGINILENPSFEDGEMGWVPNDGTIDILDSANPTEDDGKYLKFVSTADNGYFESVSRAVPSFVAGSCSANIFYKTTEEDNFKLKVLMGVSVLAVLDLPASNWERKAISFPCPDEGEPLRLRVVSLLSGKEFLANKAGLGSDFRVREAFDASPVGTIVASILDEAQFSAQNGTGWILADGRDVSGSNYAVVKGENNVPDLRGVFLRGKDNGRGLDIERVLGNYQADAFQGHWHENRYQAIGSSGGGTWIIGNGSGGTQDNTVRNAITDTVNGTPRTANETRPKNVTVNYFIKINGKSVQTISDVGYALRAGQIITGAFQTCPVNTLEADGSEYSKLKYPHLWSAIGTTHGTGIDANHGKLPDYRGRFLRGHANGSSNDPDRASRTAMAAGGVTGDNVGSVQSDSLQQHTHTAWMTGSFTVRDLIQPAQSRTLDSTGTSKTGTSTDARTSTETRPKNAYVKYCVQTVNTDITGTFRQVDELEDRLRKSGSILSKKISGAYYQLRIYSDGWVEYKLSVTGSTAWNTVSLPVALSSTSGNFLNASGHATNDDASYIWATARIDSTSTVRFKTGFTHSSGTTTVSAYPATITIEGYGASSVLATHGVHVDY